MWTYVLTSLDGTELGELTNADDRKLYLPLSRPPTASFKVRWDDPHFFSLWSSDCLLKVYDEKTLRFHGPIMTAEADSDPNSVAVNAVGTTQRLAKRLAGKSASGQAFTSQDRGSVVKSLIDAASTENETGITVPSFTVGSTVTYTAGPYKPVLTCVQDLADTLDGFDWTEQPIEYAAGKLARFNGAPTIGGTRNDAVFEFGLGRTNVRKLKRTKSWDTLANKVYHIADEGPDAPNFPVQSSSDATSIAARGLYEDLAEASGLTDNDLRLRLVQEHVRVRKLPREVYEFEPDPESAVEGRVPDFGTDYDVGDIVPLRVGYNDVRLFDGFARVWGVNIEVDSLGQALVKPITVPEE